MLVYCAFVSICACICIWMLNPVSGHGFYLGAVAAPWLRFKVFSIPAVHSDSLGAVIVRVRFVVWCWCHGCNWNKTVLYSVTSV